MRATVWLYLFAADTLADLCSIGFGWNGLRYFTKPLIVALLAAYMMASVSHTRKGFFVLLGALLGSLLGDVFLLADENGGGWFMAGLGSFLAAHICYIFFFRGVPLSLPAQRPPQKTGMNLMVIIWVAGLLLFLFPVLGPLRIPVLLYSTALCWMVLAALRVYGPGNQPAGRLCAWGAWLFLISDSLLAIGRFYHPLPLGAILVMSSYAMAQLLMVLGCLRYLEVP